MLLSARLHRRRAVLPIMAGIALTASCAGAGPAAPLASPQDASLPSAASGAEPSSTQATQAGLCAEFPPARQADPGDLEGWFNAAPANADGSVITDPAQWPDPRLVAHPRVALVDTDTGAVISTYDRIACSVDDPTYAPTLDPSWPTGSTAIVDMDTGELLDMQQRQ